MVPSNDPIESFFNSLQVVKGALSPLESGIRKAVKDLEHCWPSSKNEYNSSLAFDRSSRTNVSNARVSGDMIQKQSSGLLVASFPNEVIADEQGKNVSIECFIGFVFDQLTRNLQKFDSSLRERKCKNSNSFTRILDGKGAELNGFMGNLKFARVGGLPEGIVGVEREESVGAGDTEETLDSISLSNDERLRSTLSTVSLMELIELVPHLVQSSNEDYPDKTKPVSVQDFFRYTESEGRRLFEELDRDGDGQVSLEDLEVAVRKRRLPQRYAREFMRRARTHLFSKSFGWKQFSSLMEQKEPTILRAYTTLCLSKSGTQQKSEIMASLKNAGLAKADTEESISYGRFRDLMLLLPSDRHQEDYRRICEATAVDAVSPSDEKPSESVLKSALAGGLSCAFSAALMHPVDTVKTRVQASTTLTFLEILSKLPELGVRGLYKGSIPAILGQFSSHGLRTGICEISRLVLINVAPTLLEIQVQSLSSFCGTFLGTVMRVPCEVLKQRLQAGTFDNVGEALAGSWREHGPKGFFRGTGATLCREIPFYVAGSGLYEESKKVVQKLLGRDLEPWETIAVGALSGGLTAVMTTPFDVIKTRMMTAVQGQPLSSSAVALYILHHEGPLGLFKGSVPRFFWVAPLGAINFAGYELARKAMDKI